MLRAIRLPVEYIPLAKGDSRSYLILEGLYDILLVSLVLLGFWKGQLFGAGLGVAAAGVLNLGCVYGYATHVTTIDCRLLWWSIRSFR